MATINKEISKDGGSIEVNYRFNNNNCSTTKVGAKSDSLWLTVETNQTGNKFIISAPSNNNNERHGYITPTYNGSECTNKKIKVTQPGGGVTPSGFSARLTIDNLDNGDIATIDWGDNSERTVIDGSNTVYHTYQSDELFTATITAEGYVTKITTFRKGGSEGRTIAMEPSTPTGCSCRTANIGDIQPNTNIRPFMDNDVTIATFTSTTECSSNNFTFVQTEGANIATDITASKTPYGHYAVKAAIITKNPNTAPRSEKFEIRINNTKCEEFTITQEAGSSSLCYCEEISIPIIEFEWDNMDADTVMINDPSNCIESLSQPVDDTEHFWITATTEYISIEPKDKNTGTADYIDSCFVYFKLNDDSLCVKQFTAIQKGTDAPIPTTECAVSNIVNGNPLPAISSAGVVICEFDGNINCSPENFTLIHIYGTEILSHSEGSSIITGVSISKVENHFKIYATSYSRNDGQERTERIAIYINNVGLGGHFKITQNGAQP